MKSNSTPNSRTILSNSGGRCVELLHRAGDPTMWIVRRSKKFLWFRVNSSTVWFFSKDQAMNFAKKQIVAD